MDNKLLNLINTHINTKEILKVSKNSDIINLILSINNSILNNSKKKLPELSAVGRTAILKMNVCIAMSNGILNKNSSFFEFPPKFSNVDEKSSDGKIAITIQTKEYDYELFEKINTSNTPKVIRIKNNNQNTVVAKVAIQLLIKHNVIKLVALGEEAIVNQVNTLCYINLYNAIYNMKLHFIPNMKIVEDNFSKAKTAVEWTVYKE